ncbi:MAG: hypothetical protein J0H40_17705 [Rhizobiales bacterium]|nr:hypothetical protein [Hyphomicrobiales bacterium]
MSSAQEAIQRLQIETTSDGTDAAAASLDKLAAAYGGVTVASTDVEKSTTSLDSKFSSIEKRYVTQVKALSDYQKVQKTVNAAVSQNPALQDRANTVLAAAKQRYDDLTGTQSAFEKGLEAAGEKATELTHELGPLGSALSLIGPAGLAIGAAIGVAVLALDKLKEQAEEAGRWAAQLQNAANVIGLNATQLQALNEAAESVGVSANDNISAFERFSVSLGQLRDGSGQLYAQLLKVNPTLVNQLSVTKDAATGWNLLAQAYSQADKQQQALIARAAFGRAGGAEGGVLLATANAGGITSLQAANEDAISQDQIKRWSDLTTQIKSATEAAQHNFQSIFTTSLLEKEKAFAENLLNVSRYARDFKLSDDLKFYLSKLGSGALTIAGGLPIVGAAVQAAQAVGQLTTPGFIPRPSSTFKGAGRDSTFGAVDSANSVTSQNQVAASLGVQASQAKATVAALGSAATSQQRLDAAAKQLALDLQNGTIDQATYNKALAGVNLDARISQQNLYNSTLGELATTQDIVTAKSLALQKAQQQGANLTSQQIAAVKELTAANDEWARVSAKAQLGIFDIATATKAAGDQVRAQQAPGGYLDHATPDQVAAAYQSYATKVQALGESASVAGSKFPQLQQAINDAGNSLKQIDTLAVSSVNNIASGFASWVTGAKSFKDAMRDTATSVINDIAQIAIKTALLAPFGGSATGLAGLFGIKANASGGVYANDNISDGLHQYADTVLTHPTLFRFANGDALGVAGEAGAEAIMPLRRGPDGKLGVVAARGGGSVVQHFAAPQIVIQGNADDKTIIEIKQALASHQRAIAAQGRAMQSAQRYQSTGVR